MVKIFIDPGHGGTDSGAVANGLQEKVLTLKISLKIKEMLVDYENVQVMLSRETDKTLSLKQRTDMANQWRADYLVSIHINAGGGTGFESYILPGVGGITVTNHNVMHTEIMKQLDVNNRGKKSANFHMLRESHMPAILTENLFIDNNSDVAKLKQDAYIDRIARGHVNGLVRAYGLKLKQNVKKEGLKVVERDINKVSDWAAENWKEAQENGYFDGTRPGATLTREEAAVVVNRLRRNFLRLIAENREEIEALDARLRKIENEI